MLVGFDEQTHVVVEGFDFVDNGGCDWMVREGRGEGREKRGKGEGREKRGKGEGKGKEREGGGKGNDRVGLGHDRKVS